MGKKVSLGAVIALVAITVAITFTLSYNVAINKFNKNMADVNERQAMYSKLSEVDTKVRSNYLGEIDEAKLKDGMCAGYIAGLSDSKGQYMSAEKYREYLNGSSGKFIGVGVETIEDEDGNMEVVTVLPGSSAEKNDVKKGDVIIAIDGKDVKKIGYSDAINKLDGTANSVVQLKLLQKEVALPAAEGEKSTVSVKAVTKNIARVEYEKNTVSYHVIDSNTGYIAISQFTSNTASQLEKALASLKQSNVTGIIFDVRNSVGGSVEAAGDVLDTLLPAGNLISSIDKQGKTTVEKTSDAKELGLPMSVIVNNGTYGASEIFASAIKDYKKGTLVGETTAGKGTKDAIDPLSDGSAIVISVANYVTLSSGVFTDVGIAPNTIVALSSDQRVLLNRKSLPEADDPQIQAAITALKGQSVQKK